MRGQLETFFDDGDQDINTDGGPDLGFDGILGGAEEGFDAQVLRVALGSSGAGEDDGLVAGKAGGVIDGLRVTAAVAGIGLAADDEEGAARVGAYRRRSRCWLAWARVLRAMPPRSPRW